MLVFQKTILLFLFSISAFSSESCFQKSFQVKYLDFSGSCMDLIKKTAQEQSCSKLEMQFLEFGMMSTGVQQMSFKESTFCYFKASKGFYQVMYSEMNEPPVASVHYVRFD